MATLPLLRAKELAAIVDKAQISLAVCDARLTEELEKARPACPTLTSSVVFGDGGPASLETLAAQAPATFAAATPAVDDVCLIGFTSGTTGVPKGTMHFHRDMLAICDGYARHLLAPTPEDRFIGTPPLAFTFGLGGLVLFPLRVGASTVLLERRRRPISSTASRLPRHDQLHGATAYRAMNPMLEGRDISSLRYLRVRGEALPKPTFDAWEEATGISITEGIGATEMLHIFIGSSPRRHPAGATASRCRATRRGSSTTP